MKDQIARFCAKHDLAITVVAGITWGIALALLIAWLLQPGTNEKLAALDSLLMQ